MKDIRIKGIEKLSALLDIEFNYSHAKHNFELGLPLEESLRHFFRPYFPNRYGFSNGYIVDDAGTVSNQCDWIIYDSHSFAPLMAQIHGGEGAEWFPFDCVYGCVEIKRTLTIATLDTALRQIAETKKLRRKATNLLQITPHFNLTPKLVGLEDDKLDNICNPFYVGIYAYFSEDFKKPETIQNKIEEFCKELGPENMPEYIAIHGQYYVRKATYGENDRLSINSLLEKNNCYVTLPTEQLTAGIFYTDLMFQFANTRLSAEINTNVMRTFLVGEDAFKGTGKIVKFA